MTASCICCKYAATRDDQVLPAKCAGGHFLCSDMGMVLGGVQPSDAGGGRGRYVVSRRGYATAKGDLWLDSESRSDVFCFGVCCVCVITPFFSVSFCNLCGICCFARGNTGGTSAHNVLPQVVANQAMPSNRDAPRRPVAFCGFRKHANYSCGSQHACSGLLLSCTLRALRRYCIANNTCDVPVSFPSKHGTFAIKRSSWMQSTR